MLRKRTQMFDDNDDKVERGLVWVALEIEKRLLVVCTRDLSVEHQLCHQ